MGPLRDCFERVLLYHLSVLRAIQSAAGPAVVVVVIFLALVGLFAFGAIALRTAVG
jgi:hypothetical protein